MTQNPEIFLALPCLNPTIEQWKRLEAYVSEFRNRTIAKVSVCVVDDGSKSWVDPPAELTNQIKLIRFEKNRGKGGAMREAVLAMPQSAEIFAFTDFDLPYPVDNLIGVCSGVLAGLSDLCIGDRSFNRSYLESVRFSRKWVHRFFRFFIRTIITGGLHDTQCGLKAYSAPVAREIVKLSRLEGFLFDLEWIYIALKHRLSIRRWPVDLEAHHDSTPFRLFRVSKMGREFWAFSRGILFKKYQSQALLEHAHQARLNLSQSIQKK